MKALKLGWAASISILAAPWLHAQSYSLNWWSVDGGGGTSTNAAYSVSGTIGQPDAGTMSGGGFTLTGGFWSEVAAVQTPGTPFLNVIQTNGLVAVFWEKPATGFILDQTTALSNAPAATVWSQVPFPYQTNATHLFISLPAPSGHKFYRLRKP